MNPKKTYPDGGMTPEMYNSLKYYQNQQNNPDRQFLMDMSNSPLFQDRAAKMLGMKAFDWTDKDYENMRGDIQKNISDLHFIPTDNPYPMMPSAQGVYQEGLTDTERENMHFLNYMKDAPLTKLFPKKQALTEQIADYYGVIDKNPHSVFYKPGEDVVRLHEGSHGSTRGLNPEYWDDALGRILPSPEKITNTGGDFMYLSNPTEQKARVDVMRKMMIDNQLYDPINEEFQEKHYQNLKQYLDKNKESIKTTNPDLYEHIKQSYDIYDKDNFIRLMNSFVQNDSKNNPMTNQTVQYAAYGGMIGGPGDDKKKKKSKDVGEQNTFSVEDISASPYTGKSYHAYPTAAPEDMFKRTMGDMMYDMFRKDPRVKTVFANGGPINPPIKTDDPNDPRLHSYLDSLNLYNAYQHQLNTYGDITGDYPKGSWKKFGEAYTKEEAMQDFTDEVMADDFKVADTEQGYKDYIANAIAENKEHYKDEWRQTPYELSYLDETGKYLEREQELADYYNSLSFKDPAYIGYYESADMAHSKINPIDTWSGRASNPVFKAPVQPYEYTGDIEDVYANRYKIGRPDAEFGSRPADVPGSNKPKSSRLKDLMADAGDTDYSFAHRKEIAKSLGIDNYTGSLEQNKIMKDYFKNAGKESAIEVENVSTNIPVPRDIEHKVKVGVAPVNAVPTVSTPQPVKPVSNMKPKEEIVPKGIYRGTDAFGNPVYDEQLSRVRYYAMGGPTDPGKQGMMKARLAYEEMHGNPAAKRMVTGTDNPYNFGDGTIGTHYMASFDNYAVPQIQENSSGNLILNDYGPLSNEAMRFDSPEDANYFAENYKTVAPAFRAMGGFTKPQYEAEKGEVVDGGMPVAFNGGSITPNSMTSGKINGQTHEQGGVDMAGGKRVFSDRLKVDSNFLKDLDI